MTFIERWAQTPASEFALRMTPADSLSLASVVLLIASHVQAQTPACGTTLSENTVLDSDMVCAGTALFMDGPGSNNVTLDCAGHSITTEAVAVRISGVAGASVENCTIVTENSDFADAIRVQSNSSNITITGNDVTTGGLQSRGVRLIDTHNSEVTGNTVATSGLFSHGIRLGRGSSDNLVDGNTISTTRSASAIQVFDGACNNEISNNDGRASGSSIHLRAGSDSNLFRANHFESDAQFAVRIDSSSDNRLVDNTLTSTLGFVRSRKFGIQGGGLSVDGAGNIVAIENNFGSRNRIGTTTVLFEVDASSGEPSSVTRLTMGGNDIEFGFDALEVMPGGQLFALAGGNQNAVYEVNRTSGEVTLVLSIPLGMYGPLNGLEATGADTLLATTNGGELATLGGGAGLTVIGTSGIGWTGVAIHPSSGKTYAISRWRDETTLTTHLYEINPATGSIVTEIGDTGFESVSDFDFAPDGTLYGSDEESLVEIDISTGAATRIGDGFGPDPFEPPSENNSITNNTFQNADGSIRFTDTINLPSDPEVSISEEDVAISVNMAFVDSTLLPFLDTPARITLAGLSGSSRNLLVDNNDDGTFETCTSTRCTFVSFADGTLEFDVTGFTTYSSEVPSDSSGSSSGGFAVSMWILFLLSLGVSIQRLRSVSRYY